MKCELKIINFGHISCQLRVVYSKYIHSYSLFEQDSMHAVAYEYAFALTATVVMPC